MKFLFIAWKDLKAEFRTKQMLNSMMIFALTVMVVFGYSFGDMIGDTKLINQLAPGLLWIAFVFSGMLGLSRSFAGEKEEGCLEGLKLCPTERATIYTGKVISCTILIFMMETVTLPLFVVLFNYSIQGFLGLFLVIILGTLGFVFVGVLLAALTVNARTREILLPVVLFPLILPVIINSVLATGKMLGSCMLGDIRGELQILAIYDVIFFIAAQILFEYVIED